jgi:PAS domain S-box-containing protein
MRFFAVHKTDSIFTWASPEISNVIGYNDKEIVGLNPYDNIHPDDFFRVLKCHFIGVGVVEDAQIQTLRYRFKHKNGNYIWCKVNFTKYENNMISYTKKMSKIEIFFFKIYLFYVNNNNFKIKIN